MGVDAGVPQELRARWGANLRRERRRAGVSVTELARGLGATRASVWNWEEGKHAPTFGNRRLIAELLAAPGESAAATKRRHRRLFPET